MLVVDGFVILVSFRRVLMIPVLGWKEVALPKSSRRLRPLDTALQLPRLSLPPTLALCLSLSLLCLSVVGSLVTRR